MTASTGPAAGWYDDPEVRGQKRYWDGVRWTEHRAVPHAAATPAPGTPTLPPVPSPPVPRDRVVGAVAGIVAVVGAMFVIGGLFPDFLGAGSKFDGPGLDRIGYLAGEIAPVVAFLGFGILALSGRARVAAWGLAGTIAGYLGFWLIEPLAAVEDLGIDTVIEEGVFGPGVWLQAVGLALVVLAAVIGVVGSSRVTAPPTPAARWLWGLGVGTVYALSWALDWFTFPGGSCCSPFTADQRSWGDTVAVVVVMVLGVIAATLATGMQSSRVGAALALGLAVPAVGQVAWLADVLQGGDGPSLAPGGVVLVMGTFGILVTALVLAALPVGTTAAPARAGGRAR
jgi:hypothetical protein